MAAARRQCAGVVVVDNTPGTAPGRDLAGDGVVVLHEGVNRGLAAALNAGLRAVPDDAAAVLLLDQDTGLPDGLVAALLPALEQDGVGAVGPLPVDAATGRPYARTAAPGRVVEVPALMTSGMLVARRALDAVPAFREELFVDWVDNAWCLAVRASGLRLLQDGRVMLPHSVGDGRDHRVAGRTVRVLHYPAWRHYEIGRNGVLLAREQLRAEPAWVGQCALYLGRQLVTAAAFGQERGGARALLRGVVDALRGSERGRRLPAGAEVPRR